MNLSKDIKGTEIILRYNEPLKLKYSSLNICNQINKDG